MGKTGGSFAESDAKQAVQRVAAWIEFTSQEVNKRSIIGGEIKGFVKKAITRHFAVLDGWCDSLSRDKKAGTVINYLNAVAKFCLWYSVFNPAKLKNMKGADYLGFSAVVKMMRKNLSKSRKEQGNPKTMKYEVFMRHLPEGGFPALQEVVIKEYNRLKQEVEGRLKERSGVPKKTYNEFAQLAISAFYVFMPQGRVGGFEGLTMDKIPELLAQGHTLSTTFKTKAKYGYQPIIGNDLVIEILRIYVEELRRVATENFRSTATGSELSNKVWLTFQGIPDKPGRRLTDFYRRTMKLHVTTTTIRALMETETKNAELRGEITPAQRISVQNVNGHTGATVKAFYLRDDRSADATMARRAFTQMSVSKLKRVRDGELVDAKVSNLKNKRKKSDGFESDDDRGNQRQQSHNVDDDVADNRKAVQQPQSLDLMSVMQSELDGEAHRHWRSADTLEPSQWGSDHPEKRENVRRVNWTESELNYIVDWCTDAMRKQPALRKTIVAQCREAIWLDPTAMKIFHVNHVLDTDRLKAGYRKAIRQGMFPSDWN